MTNRDALKMFTRVQVCKGNTITEFDTYLATGTWGICTGTITISSQLHFPVTMSVFVFPKKILAQNHVRLSTLKTEEYLGLTAGPGCSTWDCMLTAAGYAIKNCFRSLC